MLLIALKLLAIETKDLGFKQLVDLIRHVLALTWPELETRLEKHLDDLLREKVELRGHYLSHINELLFHLLFRLLRNYLDERHKLGMLDPVDILEFLQVNERICDVSRGLKRIQPMETDHLLELTQS